ncbi:MAG TPA: prenyltransferase/squalene oxidase repeat-containing protein [Tepidisphaeraceae bacterium]|jgi:hypothetical protein
MTRVLQAPQTPRIVGRALQRAIAVVLANALLCTPLASPSIAAPKGEARSGVDDVIVDARTEKLINSGLKFLAARQLPNGSWNSGDRNHSAAITAYVLMGFLSAGNLPNEGEHGAVVRRGLDFLLGCVRPDGYIAAAEGENNMYGHGIATIALGEFYGMTGDDTIKPRLERAINCIIKAQHTEGGWRYNPRPHDSDISATVLQVVALRVARNSGIDVPAGTIDRAVAYVKNCAHKSGGFTYQAKRGEPGFSRTAAAVYSLQVCGLYDDPLVTAGSTYLFDNLAKPGEYYTYGSYYAAPVHYMMGGDTWRKWYALMQEKLLPSVKSEKGLSYWSTVGGQGGDVYGTAVAITVLAMPYGYVPLYQR